MMGLRGRGKRSTCSRPSCQTTTACGREMNRSHGTAHSSCSRPTTTGLFSGSSRRHWSFAFLPCAINSAMHTPVASERVKKGSGTFVRSTLRAVPAKVPDPFLGTLLADHGSEQCRRWARKDSAQTLEPGSQDKKTGDQSSLAAESAPRY